MNLLTCFLFFFLVLLPPKQVFAQRLFLAPTPTPTLTKLRQIEIVATPTPTPGPVRSNVTIQATPTPLSERTLPLGRVTPTPTPVSQRMFGLTVATPTQTQTNFVFSRVSTESGLLEKPIRLTLSSLESTASIPVALARKKDSADLTFDLLGQERYIPVHADFIVENGRFYLVGEDKSRHALKFSPPSFYAAVLAALKNTDNKINMIELKLERGVPFYVLDITEQKKLWGLFPLTFRSRLLVQAETNKLDAVNRDFLTSLLIHTDFAKLFAKGPNFEIKNVRFEPLSYRAGNKIVIRADLVNTGTDTAYSLVGSHVKNWLYYKDQPIYGNDEEVISLAPGESQKMAYVWNSVVCSAPFSIIFDSDRVLNEIDSKTVWYGTTACAPDHGPDLTATQITFEGLFYGGKNPGVSNKVTYAIKNIGDKNSEPVTALAKAGAGQFLSLISIPSIIPGGYFSGSFNYTPTTCDPVDINIDPQGKMLGTETNRDNNDVFEDPKITNWCNNLPKLQFDRVYWMANGYSFGKSKYPNGSYMDFEVDVGNLSWDTTVGCAYLEKIRVDINGQFFTDVLVGTVGNCANGGVYNIGDAAHMFKTIKFKLGPPCDADVKLTLNPDHLNPEIDRTDNVWTTKVKCE